MISTTLNPRKSLSALLTLAARDGQKENRAKWRNAHRAAFISGRYQTGAMIELGQAINRSKETLYKWGQAAEFFTLLIDVIFDEPARNRTAALSILRRAVAKLSPWFFQAAFSCWKYHENLWAVLGDFESALQNGWSIGDFKAHLNTFYNPAAPTRAEQIDRHIQAGLYLLQTTEGDSPEDEIARLKGRVMDRVHKLNGDRDQRSAWALVRVLEKWE